MDGLRVVRELTALYEQEEAACIQRYRVGFCPSARDIDASAFELDAVILEDCTINTVLVAPDWIDLFIDDQENGGAESGLVVFEPVTSLSICDHPSPCLPIAFGNVAVSNSIDAEGAAVRGQISLESVV